MSASTYSLKEAAERAGISTEELSQLVALAIVHPADGGRFNDGEIR
ncbi:MAG: hypothetical protein ACRDFZ_02790 [Candidatus Limnocylindria bacterium]